MEQPIVNAEFLMQKFPGKGAWTYIEIGLVAGEKKSFGWLKVKGRIDDYQISNFNLGPMKGGGLFFAVKAEIRKKIKKEAGDYVWLELYHDDSVFAVPEELIDCLRLEEAAYRKFMKLREKHQKEFVKWIYSAKTDATIASRISKTMTMVLEGKNLYDPPEL